MIMDFDFIKRNHTDIIQMLLKKENLTEFEDKLLTDSMVMEKLLYDSQFGND